MTVIDHPMTVTEPPAAAPRVKRWTKAEYHALVDRGGFEGQRIFLYRGELIEMPPMGPLHAIGIMNVTDWLYATYRPEYRVRIQLPLEIPGDSVPQPDAAVVTTEQAVRRPHPNVAALVIEVSDSSLELDQKMAVDYAAAGIPEYWILNMRGRSLEVFRDPVADGTTATGFRYATHQLLGEAQSIAPFNRPDRPVAVSILLANG